MGRKLLLQGERYSLYALVHSSGARQEAPAWTFLQSLRLVRPNSYRQLLALLDLHAASGPLRNEQKSRLLRDGIFEFKSRENDRLLYFFDPGERGATVLTHGFHHHGVHRGQPLEHELDRALFLRHRYIAEKGLP